MSNRAVILTLLVSMEIAIAAAADQPQSQAQKGPSPGVVLSEDSAAFTLANGYVTAKIKKGTGDLVSLRYQDLELLGGASGHPFGYWSHTPGPSDRVVSSVTIDPARNGGERAEVSVKGFYDGTPLGQGPGGSAIADIEIRYALGRGDSGLYTYSIFDHKPSYPVTSIGEARFCAKLNARLFDYMTIDANRNKRMPAPADWDQGTPLNMKEVRRLNTGIYAGQVEHKYDYSAIQFDIPAYGWSSISRHIGLWFINPSIEYLSGGATKVELTGHLDNNRGAAPTLLNYWRGSHYGGTSCVVAAGEAWTKVIGPFLIYCNAGADPTSMWKDALAQAASQAQAWPYAWVSGVDYPLKQQRGSVTGVLALNDPLAPQPHFTHLLVGLAAPDYTVRDRRSRASTVDWQLDAKHYEFWMRGDSQGHFTIPNVRPGSYTLHAIADGVLGEFAKTGVVVKAGESLNLGSLEWNPVRYGRQLWEIGIPDRSAAEFRHGDHYWQWGLYYEYPKEFPHDVNFIIGKSDFHKDWNYCQAPRLEGDRVSSTTWSITFALPTALRGKAILRLAIAGSATQRGIEVVVNGTSVGGTGPLPNTGVMHRDGIRGYWCERDVPFDAALLKPGANVIRLAVPANNWTQGVLYDYLRLEMADAATL